MPFDPTLRPSQGIFKAFSHRSREYFAVVSSNAVLLIPPHQRQTCFFPTRWAQVFPFFVLWPVLFSLIPSISFLFSHHSALAAGGRLIRVLRLFDLCDEELESLVYVLVVASACLGPAAVVLVRQLLAVLGRDLALLGAQIAFVAHDDDGDPLHALWRRIEG